MDKVTEQPFPADRFDEAVTDNPSASRSEVSVDGQLAVLVYDRRPQSLVLLHTEVPRALRGRHIGSALAKAAIQSARIQGIRIVAVCPFVKRYIEQHQQPD